MPFTGLGLYGGHRGNRWLRNRIKIFKQFVVPSLLAQTNQNFVIWISWRHEDRGDSRIQELHQYLLNRFPRVVFTYAGVCFWDDKFSDEDAYTRLVESVHGSMGELINEIGESKEVLMTIQPSDDCYDCRMVEETQEFFRERPSVHVYGYARGYVMDYINQRLAEWNPNTTPPFYTIRFPRETFVDPLKHLQYTGPYKSHEYVKDYLPAVYREVRGFLVGTHGENISTIFNHPFTGHEYLGDNIGRILRDFGLGSVAPLKVNMGFRRAIMRRLPYGWQRKLRYWFGERMFARFYNWIRS